MALPANCELDFSTSAWRPSSKVMLWFVWLPAAVFFTGLITAVSALLFTSFGCIFGPMLALFVTIAFFQIMSSVRRRNGTVVLSYIEAAVRLNLPIFTFLLAARRSETGAVGRRLTSLCGLLARGISISGALPNAVPEIPRRITAAIAVAEPLGQLQVTLTRFVEQDFRRRPGTAPDRNSFYRFYPMGVILMLVTLVTGFTVFIVPRFQEIFKDFKTTLPSSTLSLMTITHTLTEDRLVAPLFSIFIAICVCLAIALMLHHSITPAIPFTKRNTLCDLVAWYTPVARRLSVDHALAQVCQVLADSSRTAVPLPEALVHASALHINFKVREKLLRWRDALLQGNSPTLAAATAEMPPLIVGLLNPGEFPRASNPDNSVGVFEFLARYYRARFSRLLITLRAAYDPAVALILGLLVGFVVFALFSPLAALINEVNRYGPGGDLF
jgi:type IV pilus assembly protein PilC